MNDGTQNVTSRFREKYQAAPVLFFSPGRINLLGEHVDYNDGYVMPAAINMGVYYAIAPNSTATINFYSIDFDESFSTPVTGVQKNEGWKNYVLGVVDQFLKLGKDLTGFDCVFAGDIPVGAGMSSSAAVEAGLAFALNDVFGFGMNRKELALLCQRAEHTYPGVQCGIMDMYASLNGKKDHVLLLDCRNITHDYFPLQLDGYRIVLLNSKVHHSLASGEYNVRRQYCEEGMSVLKKELSIQSFRDIDDAADLLRCKDLLRPEVFACCKYVVEEIGRTQKGAALLQQNDLAGFGKLMFETHEGLSKLYKVSCAEIDFLAGLAMADKNVLGARLMGGGFGGCTINIIKEEAVNDFVEEAGTAYQKAFGILPEAYIMQTADGTRRL
ncbi:MAG TPA: galactokinase [Ferruginibacter sp.]|nr:galactokinase [Chitinophagaceae bacterium]HRI23744.1 galactokinase [Ferruginibacter sp.]